MPGRLTNANGDVENLYHIILTTSNITHDPTSVIQKVGVYGTYTSLTAAKAVAHRCLFDAGYEKDWFDTFDEQTGDDTEWKHDDGVLVYAVAPEGDTFKVSIDTTTNVNGWKSNVDDHRVQLALYHLLQTTVFYDKDASGSLRETNILGSYTGYSQARIAAETALLSPEDGITKKSWARYESLPLKEKDWDYGENVVVHAVGIGGENVMLSVVKEQEMESTRIREAAT